MYIYIYTCMCVYIYVYTSLNNYQHHCEVHLRYLIRWIYKEYGTVVFVISQVPAVEPVPSLHMMALRVLVVPMIDFQNIRGASMDPKIISLLL